MQCGETTRLRCYPSHAFGAGPSRSQSHGRLWFSTLHHTSCFAPLTLFLPFLALVPFPALLSLFPCRVVSQNAQNADSVTTLGVYSAAKAFFLAGPKKYDVKFVICFGKNLGDQ